MSRISFSTAGLASLAIAGAITLTGPAAYADEVACGPEVVTIIVTPAVIRTVDAVTHSEWSWERNVAISETEFAKLLVAASVEVDWTRDVAGPVEYRFNRVVLDQVAVPAVPGTPEVGHLETVILVPAVVETQDEYRHETTDKVRWERSDWGAQNGEGKGWKKTGATREIETVAAVTEQGWVVDVPAVPGTPAVPEQSHVEDAWALTSPGDDWVPTGENRPGADVVEHVTTVGDTPDGAGWRETARRESAEVLDTVWAGAAPEGYLPTGASRVASVVHEVAPGTSADAPEGEGWTKVAGSEVVVTDTASYDEVVTPELTEMLLSPPCVDGEEPVVAVEPPVDVVEPPVDVVEPPTDIVEPPVDDEESVAVAGPQVLAQAAPAEVATVLPNAGGPYAWLAPAGLLSLFGGAVVALGARRRSER